MVVRSSVYKEIDSPVTADEITTRMGMMANEPPGTPLAAHTMGLQSTAIPKRLVKPRSI